MPFSEKLVSLLLHFSKQELNRLQKMVHSPYFNESAEVRALWDYLHPLLKKDPPTIEKISKEQVSRAVWPHQPFDDLRLRRLFSDLNRLTFQFMINQQRSHYPWEDTLHLQMRLYDPALKKHTEGVNRTLREFLASESNLGEQYYYAGFRAHRVWYGQATQSGRKIDISQHLSTSEHYLDIFYLIQKLKMYVEWSILKATRSTDKKGFAEPAGFWQQAEQHAHIPLIKIYLTIIQCLEHLEEESHFFKILEYIEELSAQLTDQDRSEAYQIAQNYCAFKINSGKIEYYNQMFHIYQKMLETGLILDNGVLAEGHYKNIITSALRSGAFEWVERFIIEYSEKLPVALRDNARTFNLANLYSHQKQHQKVIELLQNVEYSDVMYALSSKVILIRTYYDLGEYLSLDSLLESFRIYVRRNRLISNKLKGEYVRFVNLVGRLSRLDVYDKEELARLKQKVLASEAAAPKKWLLEKIEALEQGRKRAKR